ncbi:MAG: hypothetical protein JNM59_06055 [Hyphomonadaceae bacterium]|nr:hypothetical protein [Hyphomonadaceae bacterium]
MFSARQSADLAVAFGDLAFAVGVFACGLFDAPVWTAGLAGAGMVAYWAASRRRILRRLPSKARANQTAIALFVVIAIQAGAYWLGLGVGGAI